MVDAGAGVEVLARDADGNPVAVRQGRVLATAFHPELTGIGGSIGSCSRSARRRDARRDRGRADDPQRPHHRSAGAGGPLAAGPHLADGYRRAPGRAGTERHAPRISIAALIPSWLPLRPASLHLVAEVGRRAGRLCRAIEEPRREDWAIIELDAAEGPMATEIRFDLLQALVEEGPQRNVARFHAACADVPENMELFGQVGFMAYAQEEI